LKRTDRLRREQRCGLRFGQQRTWFPACGREFTAACRDGRFGRGETFALQPLTAKAAIRDAHDVFRERVPAMIAHVMSEGRLFWLRPSEWSLLLVGVAFSGLLTLLF
jgi:hypothetical protein